jgi:hypothetical protein
MDVSQLSPDTLLALRTLAALPDKAFAQVSRCAFGALTAGPAFSADKVAKMLRGQAEETAAQIKCAHAGLLTLLAEAARIHADGESLRATLDDAGVGADRAGQLVEGYASAVALIRENLRTDALGVGRIVGLDWRLDFSIESSASGSQHEPVYFVTLNVQDVEGDPSSVRDVTFLCSSEQLQDLHRKVEDACEQVARVRE